jgi:hypothetical protein
MYSLIVTNRLDLNKTNVCYAMDMGNYAQQCSATPIIVVSPDKRRYLFNRDSYIGPSQNTFCFELCRTSLTALVDRSLIETTTKRKRKMPKSIISFRPIENTSTIQIRYGGNNTTTRDVHKIVRRDGRPTPLWIYPNNDHWRNVFVEELHERFLKKAAADIYTNDDDLIKMEFDDSLAALFVCSPSAPEATRIPYEVIASGLDGWVIKNPKKG